MILQINYRPRPYQKLIHDESYRRKVIVRHRGSGKTTASLSEMIKRAILKKGTYQFISPTYKMGKRNARPIIKQLLHNRPNITYNESELKVTLPNDSIIYFLGADDPDTLRGLDYHGVIFDEYSQQPSNIFGEIVRPRLALTEGRAIWIGTPKGYNNFYDLYQFSLKQNDRLSDIKTVEDTKVISKEELEISAKDMTTDEYNQEFMCSFNAAIKGAYYGLDLEKCYHEGRVIKHLYDKILPVYTIRDIGLRDYTSIIFTQFFDNEIRIIDCYENHQQGFDFYAKVLSEKNYIYEQHYFPHDIQGRVMSNDVISKYDTVKGLFGENKCSIVPLTDIATGINSVRIMFQDIRFDEEKTQDLRNAIAQYRQDRDNKRGVFRDQPLHDWSSHYCDALRYMALVYKKLTNQKKYKVAEGSRL